MKFNKKILMISAATLMLVSPVASLANANTISAASVKKVSYAKQTTVTVKKKTPQLFMATGGRALTTGKYYKKGQKLTVDQLGSMNILANSSPDAYHIKVPIIMFGLRTLKQSVPYKISIIQVVV